jgi:predicted DCC family thiol-disulfide oxidoreductase YuxK
MDAPEAIIFYDGVCALCNRLNPFVLRQDRRGVFRFAPLQFDVARHALAKYEISAGDPEMLVVLVDPDRPSERLLVGAGAVFYVLGQLGGVWKAISLLRVLPAPLLDFGYRLTARNRYRLMGRYASCPLPQPEWQDRFIDEGAWRVAQARPSQSG